MPLRNVRREWNWFKSLRCDILRGFRFEWKLIELIYRLRSSSKSYTWAKNLTETAKVDSHLHL